MMMKSATPRYDFSFNNTRDIQILRLHESPKEKGNSGSLFTKSPRAPTVPKSEAKPRRPIKPKSAQSLKHDESDDGNVVEETSEAIPEEPDVYSDQDLSEEELELPSTADLVSRLERLRNDQEMQRKARSARRSAKRNKTKVTSKNKPQKTENAKTEGTLPMIMINSSANSPHPSTPNPATTKNAENNLDKESPNPIATPQTAASELPQLPPPRRRGYVVEKRTYMRGGRKKQKKRVGGKVQPTKQATLGATLNVTERSNTQLTDFKQNDEEEKEKEKGDEEEDVDEDDEGEKELQEAETKKKVKRTTVRSRSLQRAGSVKRVKEEEDENEEEENEKEQEKNVIQEAHVKEKAKKSARLSRIPPRSGSVKRVKRARGGGDGTGPSTKQTTLKRDSSPFKIRSGKSTPHSGSATKKGPKIAFGKIVPDEVSKSRSKRTLRSGSASLESPSASVAQKSRSTPVSFSRNSQRRTPLNSALSRASNSPSKMHLKSDTNSPSVKEDFWSIYRNAPKEGSTSPTKSPALGRASANSSIQVRCEHISNRVKESSNVAPGYIGNSNNDANQTWPISGARKAQKNTIDTETAESEPDINSAVTVKSVKRGRRGSDKSPLIRSDSQTSTRSESSDKVDKTRRRSSRKRKPRSPVQITRMDEFQAARDLFGPVLCRDCELKHLIQSYKDSIKPF